VPGGVGPLTITMLMMNTLRAAQARVAGTKVPAYEGSLPRPEL
jgi:Tetrahydrofolate dehydrogenase/cyclohydrolase, NAD(P)-binding domain